MEFEHQRQTLRCVICGSSRLDREGYKCAICGGAPGLRSEQCYVSDDTKAKLLAHAEELKSFGLTLEQHRTLGKHVGALEGIGLAIAVADSLRHGSLRDLVLFLRDIAIPGSEIVRLRLDEPEQILTYFRADKPDS